MIGSVPLKRMSSHEPASVIHLKPSVVCLRATRSPATVSGLAPHVQQVARQQRIGAQLADELALFVADSQPIGVAVGGEPQVGTLSTNAFEEGGGVPRARLRVDPGEDGIACLVDTDDAGL